MILAVPEARQGAAAVNRVRNERIGVVARDFDGAAEARKLRRSLRGTPLPGIAQIAVVKVIDEMRSDHAVKPATQYEGVCGFCDFADA